MKSNIKIILMSIFMILTSTISVSAMDYENYISQQSYNSDILNIIGDIPVSDLLDYMIGMLGNTGKSIFGALLVVSSLWCFLGYRIYKFFIGVCGFIIGGLLGIILAIAFDSSIWLVIGIFLAVGFAIISFKLYQVGLFILGFVNTFPLIAIVSFILFNNLNSAIVISVIIASVAGIVVIKFKKPIIILTSSVTYGNLSGIWLSCLIVNTELSWLFKIIFVCSGIYVQTRMNNGLLESGSFIQWAKVKFGNKKSETGLSSVMNTTLKKSDVSPETDRNEVISSESVPPVNIYKTEKLEVPSEIIKPKEESSSVINSFPAESKNSSVKFTEEEKNSSIISSFPTKNEHITETLSYSDADSALKGDLSSGNHSLIINLKNSDSEIVKSKGSDSRFKQSSDFD